MCDFGRDVLLLPLVPKKAPYWEPAMLSHANIHIGRRVICYSEPYEQVSRPPTRLYLYQYLKPNKSPENRNIFTPYPPIPSLGLLSSGTRVFYVSLYMIHCYLTYQASPSSIHVYRKPEVLKNAKKSLSQACFTLLTFIVVMGEHNNTSKVCL